MKTLLLTVTLIGTFFVSSYASCSAKCPNDCSSGSCQSMCGESCWKTVNKPSPAATLPGKTMACDKGCPSGTDSDNGNNGAASQQKIVG